MAVGDSPESLHEEKVVRQQKAKLKSLREDGRAMQEQIDKTIELRNAKEAKVAMLQEDIKNAQVAIDEQQKALDNKRDVKRPLEEAVKALREDEAKLVRLEKKLQSLQATIDGKQKLLNESEVAHARLNEQVAALTVKEAGLLEHQKKTEELQKQIEKADLVNEERLRSIQTRKERIDKKLASESEVNEERVRSVNEKLETMGRDVKSGSDATDQEQSLTRGKLEEASVEIAKFADEARQQIEDTRTLLNAEHKEVQAELAKFTDELRQQLEESRQLLSQTDLDWMNFWKKLKRGSDSELKELEADWQKLHKLEPELVLKFLEFLRKDDNQHEGGSQPKAYTKAAADSDLHGFLTDLEAKVLSLYEEVGLERNPTLPRQGFVHSILIVMYRKQRELEAELEDEVNAFPVNSLLGGLEGNGQGDAEEGGPRHHSTSLADLLANGSLSELREEARRLKAEIETKAKIEHGTSSGSQPKRREVFSCFDRALFYTVVVLLSLPLIGVCGRNVVRCVMDGDCF